MFSKEKIAILCYTLIFESTYGYIRHAKFTMETVCQQDDVIAYLKIGTSLYFSLSEPNSRMKCAEVCLNNFDCEVFYIDGGSCVFGVNKYMTAFEIDGEIITAQHNQMITVKCK